MDSKSFLNRCQKSGINPESVLSYRKNFVLFHLYLETGHFSIVAFSDDKVVLESVIRIQPFFGSLRHRYLIYGNELGDSSLNFKKDICLINICKNVAEFLSVGEYAMLKKSYFKSASWFEKAKNCASLGSEILDNY